jgi:hypothetical protein
MSIKLIPLSRLEADPQGTLSEQPGGRSLGGTFGLRLYHREQFVLYSSHDSPRSLSRPTVERESWSVFWLDAP